jgi:PAS domain S-box-containing protein
MTKAFNVDQVLKMMLTGIISKNFLDYDEVFFFEIDEKEKFITLKYSTDKVLMEKSSLNINYGNYSQFLIETSENPRVFKKYNPNIFSNKIIYDGNSILSRVIERLKLVHINKELDDFHKAELTLMDRLVGNDEYLLLPLVSNQKKLGVVVVSDKKHKKNVSDADKEILSLLCDNTGFSIGLIENYNEILQIADKLEREKNLSDYYQRYNASIMESLDTAIVVFNTKMQIVEINKNALKLFGEEKQKILGRDINEENILPEEVLKILKEVRSINDIITLSNRKLKNNPDKIFNVKISPLLDKYTEDTLGTIVALNDITRSYHMEKELKKREKLAILGEMSARIAHEIRNPITIIGGFVKRLGKTEDEEKKRIYVKILNDELKRLEDLVGDVLTVSKNPSGKLDREKIEISVICKEIIEGMEEKANKKKITLELINKNERAFYFGNKGGIKQILINLIQNAIEASNYNEKVVITLCIEDKYDVISVFNKGKIIPQEILKRIFEPFFTTKSFGTGLGLSVVKNIIEEHNGKIAASSSEKGTEFKVYLPENNCSTIA